MCIRHNFVVKEFNHSHGVAVCYTDKQEEFFVPMCCPHFYLDTDYINPLCPLHTPFEGVDQVAATARVSKDTKINADLSWLEEGKKYLAKISMDYGTFKSNGQYKLIIEGKVVEVSAPKIHNKATYLAGMITHIKKRPLNGEVFKGVVKSLYVNAVAVDSLDYSLTHVPCFALVYFYDSCPFFTKLNILDYAK